MDKPHGELLALVDKVIPGHGISEGLQLAIRQEAAWAVDLELLV